MKETGKSGGEISFLQYLASVEKTQLFTFLDSSMGQAQVARSGSEKMLMGSVCPERPPK